MGRKKIRYDESKCYYCETIKKLEEFHKDKNRANGVSSNCKKCSAEIRRVQRYNAKQNKIDREEIENDWRELKKYNPMNWS